MDVFCTSITPCKFNVILYEILLSDLPAARAKVKFTLISHSHAETFFFQVSLRDPLRRGVDDDELKEIIGAAVGSSCCLDIIVVNTICLGTIEAPSHSTTTCKEEPTHIDSWVHFLWSG